MMKLILLDDDADLREELANFFCEQKFDVAQASSIEEFHSLYSKQGCDIAIIDRVLPDGDGIDLVAKLKSAGNRCGVILLTGRGTTKERIAGYNLDVDCYAVKPVGLDELSAIVASLARRVKVKAKWQLNKSTWSLSAPDGEIFKLTSLEVAFLLALSAHPGKAISRREIVAALNKNFNIYDSRNLDALVKRLRDKVQKHNGNILPVKTAHGVGYAVSTPIDVIAS